MAEPPHLPVRPKACLRKLPAGGYHGLGEKCRDKDAILAVVKSLITLGKPPALPGDSQGLTFTGVGFAAQRSGRWRESRIVIHIAESY